MAHRKPGNMNWSVAPQRSLPDAVAERVTEAIRLGVLKPGERIIESALAEQLGVSRGPLREALKSLEAVHLVETRRGRGTYVAQPTSDQILEMVAVRAVLEGLAARFVASEATPDMFTQLERQHANIRKEALAGRLERWRDLDWHFHETVCQFSGNETLLRAWRLQSNLLRLFLHAHEAYERDVNRILRNHEKLLDSLLSRDPDRAEATFRRIILRSGFAREQAELPEALSGLVQCPAPMAECTAKEPVLPRRSNA